MAEEPDYSKLPLEERLAHKVPYIEITNQFEKSPNEEAEVFIPFLSNPDLFKKVVTDSNVVAHESGIAALIAFLEYGGPKAALRVRNHVITGLCEKGLSSSRAGTKQKSIDALLWLVELDTPDPVVEQMLPCLSAKLPKLVSGTVKALGEIYKAFGAQTVSPKLILPSLPKLYSHADRTVRAETSTLTVEIYKWMGPALEQVLFPELKPVQQKDLTSAFEKVKDEKPTQTRLLKSQKDALEAESATQNGGNNGAEGDEDVVMGNTEEIGQVDAYDLMDPVDILSKLPDDFGAKMASAANWKEKLEFLNEVKPVFNVIKIANGDYGELVKVFAKYVKDVNLQVATVSAECIQSLAKGLRKRFEKYYHLVLSTLLEKTKERKLTEILSSTLDAIFESTSLSDVLDETLEATKHKTPQVRLVSSQYLIRILKETRTAPTRPEIEGIITASLKLVGDTLPGVRTNGFEAVGVLMKITGERELNPYLEKVDDIKMKKIKEFYETAEVKSKVSAPKPKPAPAARTAPSSAKAPAKPGVKPGVATKRKSLVPPRASAVPKSGISSASSTTSASSTSTLQSKKKLPSGLSTIPSKRGPTSPLKSDQSGSRIGGIGNRGLTGRSLQTPSSLNHPLPLKQDSGINDAEKAELEELRTEKQNWLKDREKLNWQVQESIAESSRLMTEIQTLSSKVDKLNEQRTNDAMNIKSKDTQLQRAQSDAEIARLKISQLENEIQLIRKQRTSSLNSFGTSNSHVDIQSASSFESIERPRQFSPLQETNGVRSEHSNKSSLDSIDRKVGSLTIDNEQKENNILSPTVLDTNDDSWRRAAEVTSQLKARIEKMKAKSRNSIPSSSGYR
ncbi:Cytoskeleton-associated protein 5 [Wickerhamomyces ciferrii]|uniref:Cytoskeleton-associated protein 5 n=1 Tax=Wickerhamomyces ciferrii (strain ATCC 14091 / BCRC 22168 / CBS 111 / JCM 3599 / NBRC 0793 / NRRL Y-1031 F-60-10) TaxID=1206466 RepID=K0KNV8_WICCF|nr:Cytoskeleton-associated protein 5 [Wickerhamomyces ciferrii]CCH43862.1 Cytoskeleton-associated protein 5 [Wickerhamomyces ciferrii]